MTSCPFKTQLPPGAGIQHRQITLDDGSHAISIGVTVSLGLYPKPIESNAGGPMPLPAGVSPDQLAQRHGLSDDGWPKHQGVLWVAGRCHPNPGRHPAHVLAGSLDLRFAAHAGSAGPAVQGPFALQASEDSHGFWANNTAIQAHHMHPGYPTLYGQIPDWRPRFFVYQAAADEAPRFAELRTTAETLSLLPGEQRFLLTYRCLVPCTTPADDGVRMFLAAFEADTTPEQATAHYLQQCVRALVQDAGQVIPPAGPSTGFGDPSLREQVREQKQLFQTTLAHYGLDEAQAMQALMRNPHTQQFAEVITRRSNDLSGFFTEIEHLLQAIEGDDPTSAPLSESPENHDLLDTSPDR